MKNLSLIMLAAAAIGSITIGGASAMPFGSVSPALGRSDVQDVRVVCNRSGPCYNTNRIRRSARLSYHSEHRYHAYRHYNNGNYYAGRRYGYYDRPLVGLGIGPFGLNIW